MGGIDGNADWAVLCNLSLEIIFVLLGDFDVLGDGANGLGGVELAGASDGLVWIVTLEHELSALVLDDIVESKCHETAIAAIAGCDAVNKVLLGEGEKLVRLDEVSTFGTLDGGECPAGTAVGLVLDWVDSTLVTPVERSINLEVGLDTLVSHDLWKEAKKGLVFRWCVSSKLVHGKLEGGNRVVLLDKALVGHPNTKAGLVFITSEELVCGTHP